MRRAPRLGGAGRRDAVGVPTTCRSGEVSASARGKTSRQPRDDATIGAVTRFTRRADFGACAGTWSSVARGTPPMRRADQPRPAAGADCCVHRSARRASASPHNEHQGVVGAGFSRPGSMRRAPRLGGSDGDAAVRRVDDAPLDEVSAEARGKTMRQPRRRILRETVTLLCLRADSALARPFVVCRVRGTPRRVAASSPARARVPAKPRGGRGKRPRNGSLKGATTGVERKRESSAAAGRVLPRRKAVPRGAKPRVPPCSREAAIAAGSRERSESYEARSAESFVIAIRASAATFCAGSACAKNGLMSSSWISGNSVRSWLSRSSVSFSAARCTGW